MTTAVEINGAPARPEDLAYLASHNYGAYTFFQVHHGAVRGLARHLERLRDNAAELFGQAPSEEDLRAWIRQAVSARPTCSVRVLTVSLDLPALLAGAAVPPDVVVEVSSPRAPGSAPLRVRTVPYQRETPWVKHRATHGLLLQQRTARQAGYDDALFVDRAGRLTEGSTWNLCLHDGTSWVWPEGPMLNGVTMQLLQEAMSTDAVRRPVLPAELSTMRAAFATNATGARVISAVDTRELPTDPSLVSDLDRLWATVPLESV